MNRNSIGLSLFLCGGFFCSNAHGLSVSVDDLFNTTLVIDGAVNPHPQTATNIGLPNFDTDANGERVKESTGIDIGSFSLGKEDSASQFATYASRFSNPLDPNYYSGARLVLSVDDIYAAWANDEYASLIYNQVHPPINNDETVLNSWYNDGLRIMQLAYSDSTQSGASNTDPGELLAGGGGGGSLDPTGLTELGERVVSNMVELGIIIDTSHGNEISTLDVVDYLALLGREDVPVCANHTVALGLQRDHRWRRGTSDAEFFALAKTEGVAGVFAYGPWVYVENVGETSTAATVEDYVQHVDYIVDLLNAGDPNDGGKVYKGTDYVGLSTDGYLDGTMARDNVSGDGLLDAPDRFKHIIQALADSGKYNEQELRSIMGLNFLRVYTKVLGGTPFPEGAGLIVHETWNGIGGDLIASMTNHMAYPNVPDEAGLLGELSCIVTNGDAFGDRIWGWVTAPVTGPYSFWISGSGLCELWLSTDESATNRQLIATVNGGTDYQDFEATNTQRSAYIELVQGNRYFIEALHKESAVTGHVSVAWQGIHFNRRVIEGSALSPGNRDAYASWDPWTGNPGDPGTGRSDDFDGDGKSNEYEYHFGLDPETINDGTDFTVLMVSNAPAVQYVYRTDNAFINYYVDTSLDLVNWSLDRRAGDFVDWGSAINNSNGTETLMIKHNDLLGGRLFIRIRAEEALPE